MVDSDTTTPTLDAAVGGVAADDAVGAAGLAADDTDLLYNTTEGRDDEASRESDVILFDINEDIWNLAYADLHSPLNSHPHVRRFTFNVATDDSDLEGVDPDVVGPIPAKQPNVCGRGILDRQRYHVRDPHRDVHSTGMCDVPLPGVLQFADAADCKAPLTVRFDTVCCFHCIIFRFHTVLCYQ